MKHFEDRKMPLFKNVKELFSKEDRSKKEDKEKKVEKKTKLKEVNLPNYQQTNLDDFFLSLKVSKIQTLQINDTNLTRLPRSLGTLVHLTELDLSRNVLCWLPNEMENLGKLEILNLSCNKFTSFPVVLTKITTLKSLDLSSNNISALPTAMLNLTKLKTLSLEGNKIKSPLHCERQTLKAIFDTLKHVKKGACTSSERRDMLANWKPYYTEKPQGVKRLADLCTDCILYNEIDYISGIHVPPVVKTYLTEEERCCTTSNLFPNLLKCSVCKKYFTTKHNFINHVCY